jgi:cytochrome P450
MFFSKHQDLPNLILQQPAQFIAQAERNGGILQLNIRPTMHLLTNISDIQEVLVHQSGDFEKSYFPKQFEQYLGSSLVNSEGDAHKKNKRALISPWRKPSIEPLSDLFLESAKQVSSSWQNGETINLMEELVQMGGLTTAKFLLDIHDEATARHLHNIVTDCHIAFCRLEESKATFPTFIPNKRNRTYQETVRVANAFFNAQIEKAKTTSPNYKDALIYQLLDTTYPDKTHLSPASILDELKGFYLTGSDPIRTLGWAFYEINKQPQQFSLLAENCQIDTNMLYAETLRKYPHAAFFQRRALKNITFKSDHHIKKGEHCLISPFILHRMEKFFPEPNEFKPERFAENEMKTWPKEAYIPFGYGIRSCIGEHFARLQARVTLDYLLHHFNFDFLKTPTLYTPNFFTLQTPDHKMTVKVKKLT